MKRTIRVMIVDDHTIVREGFHARLDDESTIEVVAEAANGVDALRYARLREPDVVLIDVAMLDTDRTMVVHRLRKMCSRTRVLMLTSFNEDQRVHEALRIGAIGHVLKDVPQCELVQAIHAAAQGTSLAALPSPEHSAFRRLTERERDVLRLIACGHNNKEIAAELHLTEGTVKGYVSAVLAKLEVADRTQAALYAVRHGLR